MDWREVDGTFFSEELGNDLKGTSTLRTTTFFCEGFSPVRCLNLIYEQLHYTNTNLSTYSTSFDDEVRTVVVVLFYCRRKYREKYRVVVV